MSTKITPVKGAPAGELATSKRIAVVAAMYFANEPSRPPRIVVENLDANPTTITFTRTGKFANGDTMGTMASDAIASGDVAIFGAGDFPPGEFSSPVEFAVSNFTDATVLALY